MENHATMFAARLHGPADLRVEEVPYPGPPGPGEVLLRITATGICGSDLHPYETGSIGDTVIKSPLILGHEFGGVVEEVGVGVESPRPGARVAVDPSQPCGHCFSCEHGQPNLCRRQHFCGLWPDDGSLCQWMRVPARNCFAVPETIDDTAAALLEPLGVALHAIDLARIRVGSSVAIIGAGPIGLCLVQTAKLAGADPICVTDKLPWRQALAERFGAVPLPAGIEVDVAIEAAWAGEAAQQAVDLARAGGTVVLVGIPLEDRLELKHSAARRKGLTILMSRRMKHIFPRAIRLLETGRVDANALVTHRFPLARTPEAFAMNAAYQDNVVKAVIETP